MNKTVFVCSKCDSQFSKWSGRCSECGSWGTLTESARPKTVSKTGLNSAKAVQPIDLSQIKSLELNRLISGQSGFDLLLGGGLVEGSLVLLGGDPGIGKSTLALQVAADVAKNNSVIYISAEESVEQIAGRWQRLGQNISNNLGLLHEDNLETIAATLAKEKPALVIIDSIQTIYSSDLPAEAGGVNQLRACTVKLLEIAKSQKLTIVIIGHVTKEGLLAGPKAMEHLVDVVLYLEGERYKQFRILRSVKNRFASVGEVIIYEMVKTGLKEVDNPSKLFLADFANRPGSVIAPVIEGSRVFLVEVQALVAKTSFGYPKRSVSGFDQKRLDLLCTILSKRTDVNLNNFDVYLNLAGGLNLKEPALDLPVCAAIITAWKELPFIKDSVVFGEVGLGGEIRSVAKTKERVKEALKLGFKKIVLPDFDVELKNLDLVKIRELNDLVKLIK